MFGLLDRWIERKIKKALHKKRSKIIAQTMSAFIEEHHPDEKTIIELRGKLEIEADRIYAVVDKSILKARIKQAKYVFWITAIAGAVIAGLLAIATHGFALAFITPLATALVAYLIELATVPIGYNQRIKGAMDSITLNFEKKLLDNAKPKQEKIFNTEKNEELGELKKMIDDLQIKVDEISKKVDAIYQKQLENNHSTLSPADDLELQMWQTWKNNLPLLQNKKAASEKNPKKDHHHHKFSIWHRNHPHDRNKNGKITSFSSVPSLQADKN